jgi:phage/plasmid primase-like uncharacterized protein
MIAADLIERARDADLLATAQALGARLKRVTRTELAGPCPVCNGTDRFSVNVKQQVWHCRGCAKGGGAISLVSHVRELNFRQAVAFLTGENTTPNPQHPNWRFSTSAMRTEKFPRINGSSAQPSAGASYPA